MSKNRFLQAAALSAALVYVPVFGAHAQAPAPGATSGDAPRSAAPEAGRREVTATGATVPNPGTGKTGPETDRERKAQERSDRVTRSICNGC